MGIFLIGYSITNNVHYKSRQFLKRYDYHIDIKLETRTISLQNIQNQSSHGIDLILESTSKINMPLDTYIAQDLKAETYRLKEKSQFDLVNEIDATVLYNSNNEIVGAYLNVWGYLGSLLALDEQFFLAPEPKLNPEKLNLANINEITIHISRINKKVIKDQKDINNFLKVINESTSKNEELESKYISSGRDYPVWFKYNNGSIINATIYAHEDFTKISFTNFMDWNYDATQEFVDLFYSLIEN